ncbi:Tad domain-containing protein [Bacillus sp. FJAT-27245]|uniref:Tad domain-containing protein n=1 Tax=Bacillus sp. FJAT-27245 TaxID=1684144 RepID=UPI0006A7858E|nr:Tad domain-containing protein [Bacillus sp. FJAT-27245]
MKMMKMNIKHLLNNQRGNALVLVSVSMLMLCGFVAVALDSGSLFLEKSKLQKALDASVLAGVQELIVTGGKPVDKAKEIALENGIDTAIVKNIKFETGTDFVKASVTTKANLTFAKIFGMDNADIFASSKAVVGGALKSSKGVVPIGIVSKEYKPGGTYIMHFQPGNPDNAAQNGNFGFLDMTEEKGNNLRNEIINGADLSVSDDMHSWTQTGLQWGNVKAGFDARITEDENAGRTYCEKAETADESCKRVMIVPMVEDFDGKNGTSEVKIVGFAMFWISSVEQHAVKGQFIKEITIGEFGTGTNFGIYKVSLLE